MIFNENKKLLGTDYNQKIQTKHVLIVGLGGLGGFVANALVRLGVENLTLVDFDCFTMSNLNRQLFSSTEVLGQSKVDVIKTNLLLINPDIKVDTQQRKIQSVNSLDRIDVVFDCVDNIETRLWLERYANDNHIPLVHGAIGGWYGQFGVVLPGSKILETIYQNKKSGIEKVLGSPTFIPPIIANMMVTEYIKYIFGIPETLINKLMLVDLKDHNYSIVFDKTKKKSTAS